MSLNPSRRSIRSAEAQAGTESTQAAQSLAGAAALASFQSNPFGPGGYGQPAPTGPEAAHPAARRLSGGRWAGKTGVLNNPQAAAAQGDSGPIWVTVPVDKIEVEPDGRGHAVPVYATPRGYASHPGESAGSIPPALSVRQ